jgi:glycosyltransferase involved in cell wall biosynthesis
MKVSVVTPSFNQGRFIERTLQSVASQSGAEIEHVVFDGGSTDNTVEILKRFSPPVRWVSRKDKGQTDAVNQGIRATDGEIIGWLNSDDIYYPGAIARVVAFFEAHPEIDLVYGMADHIDVDDRAFEPYYTEPWNYERLKDSCFICQPALFFRRRVVQKYGLLDESLNYCMDYEYWLRLGRDGARFAYIKERLAGSRMYAENKTMGSKVKVCAEINGVIKKYFGKVPDKWLIMYAQAVVDQRSPQGRNKALIYIQVAACAIASAWRWNRSVSASMVFTLFSWVRKGLGRLWQYMGGRRKEG